jgi:aminoglycoside phosphotransferase (APT) family kinase protein
MKPTTALPNDPALPGLGAICEAGLATAMPALQLDAPVDLLLCGYRQGSRATLEVRAGERHFAVKLYAEDPAAEAALYRELATVGLTGAAGARVPALLAEDHKLRALVIGWLEGPTAEQLAQGGQGERAGELAACWLRRAASLPVRLGQPLGAPRVLKKAGKWVAALSAAHVALGAAGGTVAETLARTRPKESTPHLVHGTLYARHLIDLGDGPGVIDWQRFGQGPAELDAGVFLATISRLGVRHEPLALAQSHVLLDEAARLARAAGDVTPWLPTAAPAS